MKTAHSRSRFQRLVIVFITLLAMSVTALLVLQPSPMALKRFLISATTTSHFEAFEKLTRLLSIGMPEERAKEVLGSPQKVETLSHGDRWLYMDDGPTAGWILVVEFERHESESTLCYWLNIQHTAFPNSPRSEMGKRLATEPGEGSLILGFTSVPAHTNRGPHN